MPARPTRILSRLLLSGLVLPAVGLAAACQPAPAAPHNDNFGAATLLAGTAKGQVSGTTLGATRQFGEPSPIAASTVWFRWTAPVTGAVSFSAGVGLPVAVDAFTGNTLTGLHSAGDDGGFPKAAFRTVAGRTYRIRVTGYVGSTFVLKWSTSVAPTNDRSAAAAPISGASGSLVDDTTAATNEATDPAIEGSKPTATVWYRWTTPSTGWYDFDTSGSRIGTALGVYADSTPVRLVDDSAGACGSSQSFDVASADVGFRATAGTSYLVMVGGQDDFNGISIGNGPVSSFAAGDLGGTIQLNWRRAVTSPVASGNDAFAAPANIGGTHGSVAGNTRGATAEVGEPTHPSTNSGRGARSSVWFSWTPPVTADYVLSAAPEDDGCGADVSVYTGKTLGALKAIVDQNFPSSTAVLDGSGAPTGGDGTYLSELSSTPYGVRVHLVAGTTYRIAADRIGDPGPFTLRWDIPQAAPIIRSATPGNGSIGVIWSPPPRTAGSPLTGYFVTAIPVNEDDGSDSDSGDPLTLPLNATFGTIHGLHNGTAYRIVVAGVNGGGLGVIALTRPITPVK